SDGWRRWRATPLATADDPRTPLAAAAQALANLPPPVAAGALHRLIRDDCRRFLAGIARYRAQPPVPRPTPPPVIWQEGTTVLRDYGRAGDPAVLVIPSLVNRAYVLDLTAETSLLRGLRERGLRPLLVEWDWPSAAEETLTLTDIVAGRLERA